MKTKWVLFTKLLVWHKAENSVHQVRIKLIDNGPLANELYLGELKVLQYFGTC